MEKRGPFQCSPWVTWLLLVRIVVCVHVGCHVITGGAPSLPGVGILKHRFAHEVPGSPAPREPLMHLSQPQLALYDRSWRLSHEQLVPAGRNCSLLLGVAWCLLVPHNTTEEVEGRTGLQGPWGSILWKREGANTEGMEFRKSSPKFKVWLFGKLSYFIRGE